MTMLKRLSPIILFALLLPRTLYRCADHMPTLPCSAKAAVFCRDSDKPKGAAV